MDRKVNKMRLGLLIAVALSVTTAGFGQKKPTTLLTVRAVTHTSWVNQSTSTHVTPGTEKTNCAGGNCRTTYTPAQVNQTTNRIVDVTDLVEANGSVYTITCKATWSGSNCAPMMDGEEYPAEIDGETMWITNHKGGNQGKEVRTKYKILDIRAAQPEPPAPASAPVTYAPAVSSAVVPAPVASAPGSSGSVMTNADVLALKDAGLSDQLIITKIMSSAVKFNLDTPDLVALKKAGLADEVTAAMLEASKH